MPEIMKGRQELLDKIEEFERAGRFNEHVNSPDMSMALPPGSFNYRKKRTHRRIGEFFEKLFIVKPFMFYINRILFRTKVYGRKNLRKLRSAVATCNHVNIFDNLAIKHALRGRRVLWALKSRKVFITAAPFNNRKGFLGHMMRVGGMVPLGGNLSEQKNFLEFFAKRMKQGSLAVFYPEQAMWWCYEKPRPFKDGAFHCAAKYNVPILPMFIAFTPMKKLDKQGQPRRKFHIFILPPIKPDPNKSLHENIDYLRNANYEACKRKYEEFYNKPLEYLPPREDDESTADTISNSGEN